MAGRRVYRRDSRGRFAGGGGGRVTFGRAGGFASASIRAAFSGARRSAAVSRALGNRTAKTERYLVAGRGSEGVTVALMRRKVTTGEMQQRNAVSPSQTRRQAIKQQRRRRAGSVVKAVTIPVMRKR